MGMEKNNNFSAPAYFTVTPKASSLSAMPYKSAQPLQANRFIPIFVVSFSTSCEKLFIPINTNATVKTIVKIFFFHLNAQFWINYLAKVYFLLLLSFCNFLN